MSRPGMLTTNDGPVVTGEKTLRAMIAIRRDKLLAELYGQVWIARPNFAALGDVLGGSDARPWLKVVDDHPERKLPDRVATASPSEAATLRTALAVGASLVLLEGPIKERAKLSFIKSEGTLSILVWAYRQGKLSAVKPMVNALRTLGHGDVLPPPELLEAMWKALDGLTEG